MANENNANFEPTITTPTRQAQTDLKPFRFWCQKVLPLVYDDSLSYYELLCKVVDYLNKTMEDVTNISTDMTNLYNSTESTIASFKEVYDELQNYVNDYFNNLDVQEEINNKLDSMAIDGSLSTIINPLVISAASEWLKNNLTPTEPPIDKTLAVDNAAANSLTTGQIIGEAICNTIPINYQKNIEITSTAITLTSDILVFKSGSIGIASATSFSLSGLKSCVIALYYNGSNYELKSYTTSEYFSMSKKNIGYTLMYIDSSGNKSIYLEWYHLKEILKITGESIMYTIPWRYQKYINITNDTAEITSNILLFKSNNIGTASAQTLDISAKSKGFIVLENVSGNYTLKWYDTSDLTNMSKSSIGAILAFKYGTNNFEYFLPYYNISNYVDSELSTESLNIMKNMGESICETMPIALQKNIGITKNAVTIYSDVLVYKSGIGGLAKPQTLDLTDLKGGYVILQYNTTRGVYELNWITSSEYGASSKKYIGFTILQVGSDGLQRIFMPYHYFRNSELKKLSYTCYSGENFISKFKQLCETGGTLYVYGNHNLVTEYASAYSDDYLDNLSEIPFKPNYDIAIIGDGGTTLSLEYTGTNDFVMQYLSIITTESADITLKNINLVGKNIRYCVHDEHTDSTNPYRSTYENCNMSMDNSESTWHGSVACLGGGLGINGVINVQNCIFKTVVDTVYKNYDSLAWHNSGAAGAQGKISITNCFCLDSTIQIASFGNSDLITDVIISNCQTAYDIEKYNWRDEGKEWNMNIYEINNIVKTN